MSKQRPDPEKLANELSGASAFFRKPAPRSQPESASDPLPSAAAPVGGPVARPHVRPERSKRRQMIRHAFEVHLDQLERLRGLAAEQRERGELGSMSRMVRDAIDRLLEEHGSDGR